MPDGTVKSEREQQILAAAFTTFERFGYRKTSLDDIARQASLPRTAIYRVFKGKEAIFKALSEAAHEAALNVTRLELKTDLLSADQFVRAFVLREQHLLSVGHSGPHAAEIEQAYHALAADIVADYNQRFERLLVSALKKSVKQGHLILSGAFESPTQLVFVLRACSEGIKREVKNPKTFSKHMRSVILSCFD